MATRMVMGDRLTLGQVWRRKADCTEWTVYQVHRPDRLADMRAGGTRLSVSFRDLRRRWEHVR